MSYGRAQEEDAKLKVETERLREKSETIYE